MSAPAEKSRSLALEASLLSAALFLGSNPVAVKFAAEGIPALPFVAIRFTLAGVLLMCVALVFRERVPPVRDLAQLAAIGIVGVGLNNVLFTYGVTLTTASETALIYATPPLWGMMLAFLLGLERPTLRGALGVAVAIIGVFVVVSGGLGGGETTLAGALLVAGAATCWGSYSVLTLRLLRRYSALVVATYTILFAGLAVTVFALPSFASTDWSGVGGGAWLATAYSIGPVAAYPFWAWQNGVSRLGANQVLVYQYLVTFFGVAAGVVVLGEGLGWHKVVGGAVILSGVYLARRR